MDLNGVANNVGFLLAVLVPAMIGAEKMLYNALCGCTVVNRTIYIRQSYWRTVAKYTLGKKETQCERCSLAGACVMKPPALSSIIVSYYEVFRVRIPPN